MRTRAFAIARFAVYAAIIAFAVHHFAFRDTEAKSKEPAGTRLSGETTQGLPVTLKLRDAEVVAVEAHWRARCDDGGNVTMDGGFVDAHRGDFERAGQRFADRWDEPFDGGRLAGRLEGEASYGVARGSVSFKLTIDRHGDAVRSCETGPIGFAIDLPR